MPEPESPEPDAAPPADEAPEAAPDTPPLDPYTAHYPPWARELARKYFTKTVSTFILHGDIRDVVPTEDRDGARIYPPLRRFLTDDLFAARDVVVFYDRSAGIHFADAASRRDFSRALAGEERLAGTEYENNLPKAPNKVFELLEDYFRLRLSNGTRVACVIDYAETVAPMAEASMYSAPDRQSLVYLQKWSRDSLFLESDFTLTLLTENLTDLNQQLVQSPHTAEIYVPIPEGDDRQAYIDWALDERGDRFRAHSDVSPEALAQNTAGLNYTQLRTILADVLENQNRLTAATLSDLKKEFIEAEAYGMLEFIETDNSLDLIAGHTEAKRHLRQAAHAVQTGQHGVLPMGYLVSGPVGCGKTFLINCFAGEIGIPMVKLKNFRSQWQGVTEGNLEKILNLLEAMTPVAVMIDEADAALGDRDAQGDSGVSQRVFSQIVSFMSDPAHRGRVIFFLVTARPDLMPVDLKRQGRAEEHLSLFYPHTRADREELLRVMMRRTGVDLPIEAVPPELLEGERTYSGADMEAVLTRAAFRAAGSNDGTVTPALLQETVNDFIPPTYPTEVELQQLAAVLECTSRDLLPERFRSMKREEVVERLEQLKRMVD
ncbi:AAA+ superfamily predicted ATPase [Salinibacter ruber]|uniref:ATP-binding protein n=1 Tax=Salinibacter ruber TaxID=146919 RepID=UPI00161AF3FF|nr:ATP-binding protein [Salinibacter ruber]MBB4060092.1 AAA+ superfamily predicted ATPase [Salinibacter ruber]MBB4069698.1 AAA+ superfamily predicted ATPase [Salinibacter ruber]MCS3640033.1 AAA+ superfamily predicted ATPase [Salinibacter ruber]MCS3934619.1 AAA+ superfamily predicted ATPase [Salinibacter ruber]MCS4041757.1 AAA+ superfamily predicted ATPase [Salinibacter ruber]